MFEILRKIKEKLAQIDGVKSCEIGVESNLTSNQCPFIRIVALPSHPSQHNAQKIEAEVSIVFGEELNTKIKLEDIYQKIYAREEEIKEKMKEFERENKFDVSWIETIPDEDALRNLKAAAIIFKIEGFC